MNTQIKERSITDSEFTDTTVEINAQEMWNTFDIIAKSVEELEKDGGIYKLRRNLDRILNIALENQCKIRDKVSMLDE